MKEKLTLDFMIMRKSDKETFPSINGAQMMVAFHPNECKLKVLMYFSTLKNSQKFFWQSQLVENGIMINKFLKIKLLTSSF